MKEILRASLLAAALGAALSARAVTYDFESVAPTTPVPFSYTVSGLTASFSGGSGYQVNIGSPNTPGFSGRSLGDNATGTYTGGLTVAFGSPLSALSTAFGTNGVTTLTLTAFLGNAQVGTATATSTVTPGFTDAGGTIGFSGVLFDRVVLSTPQVKASFDNIVATPVPEPSALAVLGLPALALLRRRKRA